IIVYRISGDALERCRCLLDYGYPAVFGDAMLHEVTYEDIEGIGRHIEDQRVGRLRQLFPIGFVDLIRAIPGKETHRRGMFSGGQRDAGISGGAECGGDAGHELIGDLVSYEGLQFVQDIGKDRDVAAFEADDKKTGAGMFDQQRIDLGLRSRALAFVLFAHGDDLGIGPGIIAEDVRAHETVYDHDIRALQPAQRFDGEQFRITRAGARQDHFADMVIRGVHYLLQHQRSNGNKTGFIDQDRAAAGREIVVSVKGQGRGGADRNTNDIIQTGLPGRRLFFQGIHIKPVFELADGAADPKASDLYDVFVARDQGLAVHPAKQGLEFLFHLRRTRAGDQQVTAADIDIVFQLEYDALRGEGLFHFAAADFDGPNACGETGRQHRYGITLAIDAAGDLAGVAAVVMQFFRLRPDDILYAQTAAFEICVDVERGIFE